MGEQWEGKYRGSNMANRHTSHTRKWGKGYYLGLQKKRMGVKPHTTFYFPLAGIGGNKWEG